MAELKPTIGLEIHAELKTRTKMFCDSLNNPDEERPNVNVCPVCLAHPGALPAINKEAVEDVIKVGLALNGKIAPVTKFDRKNYFYPDLPKGYQISQYDKPLVEGGELCGVRIHRVHLEEDTGRLLHGTSNAVDAHGTDAEIAERLKKAGGASFVDFNRAGVPLMELVTEPDIKSAEEAVRFAKEFQLILRYLGVSDANMEKGEMRVEVNISMNMGTKVELKNINSFRAVEGAVAYEIKRQTEAIEKGEKLHQETRGWDDVKQKTFSQRKKEEAHDYRYFPEPDLPPFETNAFKPEEMRMLLPELPAAKRSRFKEEFGFGEDIIESLVSDPKLASFFEEAASELKETDSKAGYQTLLNYITSDLKGILNETGTGIDDLKFDPEHIAHLAALVEGGKLTSRMAKDLLKKMFETGLDPEEIMQSEGISLVSDASELAGIIDSVIAENPAAAADFKKGKAASLQFLIGKVMAATKGRANPADLRKILEEKLK